MLSEISFWLDGLGKFAPVPVGLRAQAEDHPYRHSEECQACALHVEPVPFLEYDRKGLECQVEDSQNKRIPVNDVNRASQCAAIEHYGPCIQQQQHTIEQHKVCRVKNG